MQHSVEITIINTLAYSQSSKQFSPVYPWLIEMVEDTKKQQMNPRMQSSHLDFLHHCVALPLCNLFFVTVCHGLNYIYTLGHKRVSQASLAMFLC